jgi:hypothetical protein
MRQVLAMIAGVMCLSLVVYLREKPMAIAPPLSIPSPQMETDSNTSQSAISPKSQSVFTRTLSDEVSHDEICIGELPNEARELAAILKYLHSNTVDSFERSPQFGGNRGGFGGGQFGGGGFGGAQFGNAASPADLNRETTSEHGDHRRHWVWLDQMHGLTKRGLVYKGSDRPVVDQPPSDTSSAALNGVSRSKSAAEPQFDEKVWKVAELQLIGLMLHDHPVAYDKHHLMEQIDGPSQLRELNPFETASLTNLRAGAERVMAWDNGHGCLQVLGAIRAKENCLKCHDVKIGHLLGAFTYRIEEASEIRPTQP